MFLDTDILRKIIPVFGFLHLSLKWFHNERLNFGTANLNAVAATSTVKNADLYTILNTVITLTVRLDCGSVSRHAQHFLLVDQERTDSSVRTNISTLVTLDTVFRLPFRYVNSNTTLFISCCSWRESTIFTSKECTYR